MKTWQLAGLAIVAVVLVSSAIVYLLLTNSPASTEALSYTFQVVNIYPHDASAFTQGLVFEDGVLFEGTGLRGQSTLRRVDLETGSVLQVYALANGFFGEGIAVFGDRIVQLTWQSHKGFVYDKDSFDLLHEFDYPTEGWGITYDGSWLIMSDGTATLHFLDPQTFDEVRQIEVHNASLGRVDRLNELEYVDGLIYANIWFDDRIAMIDPQTGQVKGWVDLQGLRNLADVGAENVLNGIAYDAEGNRLFVTGKNWPYLFEIRLVSSG